jgi:hypothetical protein
MLDFLGLVVSLTGATAAWYTLRKPRDRHDWLTFTPEVLVSVVVFAVLRTVWFILFELQ